MYEYLHGWKMASDILFCEFIYTVEVRKMQKLSVIESDEINFFAILSTLVQEYLRKLEWHGLLVYNKCFL